MFNRNKAKAYLITVSNDSKLPVQEVNSFFNRTLNYIEKHTDIQNEATAVTIAFNETYNYFCGEGGSEFKTLVS